MYLARLEVSGVRNLEHLTIECSNHFNVFTGPIGAGKTAILESIHILARGRSFRSTATAAVVRRGQAALVVRGRLEDERRGTLTLSVARDRHDRASAVLNGERVRRMSEVARIVPTQLILPDVGKLILGGPTERRRFLDSGAFHVKPRHLEHLVEYQRAIQQRNALLRRSTRQLRDSATGHELDAWTRRLVELAEPIDLARREYVAALVDVAVGKLGELEPGMRACLRYQPGWGEGKRLAECLTESRERDVRFGLTHVGPHRGEIAISIDGDRAVDRLSRGQAKVLALALHLAQAELTDHLSGRKSIFLIDDIGSELDRSVNERFVRALMSSACQIFATTASSVDRGDWFPSMRLFHVEHGNCQADPKNGVRDV